jgi:Rieske Fe-S protein
MNAERPAGKIAVISRREFLLLSVGLGVVAGCQSEGGAGGVVLAQSMNVGPAERYAKDGVYTDFQFKGFFIVRKGADLFAISSVCTHKKCKLTAESDRTFYCKCHGSTFDPVGKVTTGPAKIDLPRYSVMVDAQGQAMVRVGG